VIRVSIITINLNNKPGLEKTIGSVITQTYPEIEFVVIDGLSEDGSVDIIKKNVDRVSYWVSEKDSGVYNAMNKGIAAATGDYLLFLNSGDVLNSNTVITELLKNEPGDIDLIYGNLERIFFHGKKSTLIMPKKITFDHMIKDTIAHPATLIKRSLFDRHGLYDESLKIVSDWAFFIKVIIIENATYKYKNISVSSFSMDGLSSEAAHQQLIKKERGEVLQQLFSPPQYDFIKQKLLLQLYYRRYRIAKLESMREKCKMLINFFK
jgi:glycosyltransferase involved in cell wall biosynthesis